VYRLVGMAMLEAFLPLLDKSEGKCLFYLTGAYALINETRHIAHFAYNPSKAALHQYFYLLFTAKYAIMPLWHSLENFGLF